MPDLDEAAGPVDYLVLQLPTGNRDGSIAAALLDLVESATVTVLDLMIVEKDASGVVRGVELDAIDGELRVFAGARSGLIGAPDLDDAGSILEPGTTARAAGAEVIASARIPADVLNEALDALD